MARILDAQRLAESKHLAAEETPSTADTAPVGQTNADTISFIEVGGPAHGFNASADVLACPAPVAGKLRIANATDSTELPRPSLAEAGPLFVAFRPCPDEPATPSRKLVTFHQPDHPASELYRALLGRILSGDIKTHPQAILLSGVSPGVGATTALLNLAVCAAREGKQRVAVLDLNSARPAVAETLGVSAGPWFEDFLAGRSGLEKALQPTRVASLFVLAPNAAGDRTTKPSTEAALWIVSWLRGHFDLIFIDASPWEETTFISLGDAVYLVAPVGSASAARLDRIACEIARQGGRLRGILQTGMDSWPDVGST
jgi:Mrp family chromosome partitioning ATPase